MRRIRARRFRDETSRGATDTVKKIVETFSSIERRKYVVEKKAFDLSRRFGDESIIVNLAISSLERL